MTMLVKSFVLMPVSLQMQPRKILHLQPSEKQSPNLLFVTWALYPELVVFIQIESCIKLSWLYLANVPFFSPPDIDRTALAGAFFPSIRSSKIDSARNQSQRHFVLCIPRSSVDGPSKISKSVLYFSLPKEYLTETHNIHNCIKKYRVQDGHPVEWAKWYPGFSFRLFKSHQQG